MNKKIWGNSIVKNEGRYLWFAVKSIVEYLDKVLIWDTGSSDDTISIIKLLQDEYGKKIEFKEIGEVDKKQFTQARQKMLDQTKSDWVLILDGDEVWWEESIKEIVRLVNNEGDNFDLIVNPYYSVVGDIYHHQEELAGRYNLAGRAGHLNIRAISRKIAGLHISGDYPNEAFVNINGEKIQDSDPKKVKFLNNPYLHFSNIERSSKKNADKKVMQRKRKIRHEIGIKFPERFKYPEVFYLERPGVVPDPWQKMEASYKLRALIETPLRRFKRRLR